MKKRLFSLFIAATLALSAAGLSFVTAYAAQAGQDIKISAPSGQNLAGTTLNLYKVFDLAWDSSSGTVTAGYSYTLNPAFGSVSDFLAVIGPQLAGKANFDNAPYDNPTLSAAGNFNKLLSDLEPLLSNDINAMSSQMFDFAKAIEGYVQTKAIANVASFTGVDPAETSHTFKNLELGYYLVTSVGKAIQGNDKVYSASILATNETPVDITLKVGVPTIDKDVSADNGSTWGKSTDTSIGSTVNFRLTSAVPKMTGYQTYTFIMHDTLSKGLTLDAGSFVVKIGGAELAAGTDYTLDIGATAANSPTSFSITFNDFIKYLGQEAAPIVVTYNAVLNQYALTSGALTNPNSNTANTNQVTLEYSNNPYNSGEGGTNTTPPVINNVYTYDLHVYKYTDKPDKKPLKGAKFELRTVASDAATALKFTKDPSAYIYTKDPNSTDADPTTLISGTDGKISIRGLDNGTYYLVETAAPDGYNALEKPVTVTITPSFDASAPPKLIAVAYTANDTPLSDCTVSVLNNTGSKLPDSGGMGTTPFTVGGIVIMLGAAAFLVARRRFRGTEK